MSSSASLFYHLFFLLLFQFYLLAHVFFFYPPPLALTHTHTLSLSLSLSLYLYLSIAKGYSAFLFTPVLFPSTGSLSQAYDELGNLYEIPQHCLSAPANLVSDDDTTKAAAASGASSITVTTPDLGGTVPPAGAEEVTLKFRLSTLKDVKLTVNSSDTVAVVKLKLGRQEGVDGRAMRLFLSGKQLPDKSTVEKLKVPKGFLIQALIPS